MILDFLKSSLVCVALSLLFVSCASTPRAPESIYDETGTLVSRTTFDAKNNIETQWKAINDSTAIFESFEDGIHTIDTLATEALRIYNEIDLDHTLVAWARPFAQRTTQILNATNESIKASAESISQGAQSLKDSFVSTVSLLSGEEIANATDQFLTTSGKYVTDKINNLPTEIDSLLVLAIIAGYGRGVTVGYQEIEEYIMAIPEITRNILGTDYEALLQKAKKQIRETSEFVINSANQDSLMQIVKFAQNKLDQLPDYMKGEFERIVDEFKAETDYSFAALGIDNKYRDAYIGAFASGWLTWQLLAADITYGLVKYVAQGKGSSKAAKITARSNRIKEYNRKPPADRDHLMPRDGHGGHWNTNKTTWRSDIPEVNAITRGRPIHFTGKDPNKMPDFAPWSRGTYKLAGLTGKNEDDFPKLYAKIAAKREISVSEAERWVKQNGLTPHHLSCTEMMLVPTALHENVPHTGAASMLRNGTCK